MDFHIITDAGVFHILSTGSAPGPGPGEHAQGNVERHAVAVEEASGAEGAVLGRQGDCAVHGG